jgi:putative ABC transport system permease protein
LKKIKYIISFCIMFIGLLIIGESHIFYLDNFYSQYAYTTLYLQDNTTSDEMITDITNSATSNDVEVFTFVQSNPNSSLTEYDIYGTWGVEKYINQNSNIFERKYTSLLLGSINFKFNNIDNIPNIKNQNEYYVIGSKESVHQFKMELIDKYAGNHPKPGYPDKESKNNTIAIWVLISCIILLFSVYDVISHKKENLIRMTMGERISKIIWENILLDSFAFITSFTLIFFILSKYTYIFFNFKISIISFVILLCINGLLYLSLYFSKVKEAFSNGENSKKLLSLNYGLKLVTTIITIFIISSNIAFIFQSYSFYRQRTFFEDYSDYYHVKFMYKPTEDSDGSLNSMWEESQAVQETFYKEFFKEFNTISVKDLSSANMGAISANRNAFDYLSSKIDELNSLNLGKDFYFILPDGMENDLEIIDVLKINTPFNEVIDSVYDYDVIYYHDNIEIVGIDEDYVYGSHLVKNPAIIYNNMSEDQVKNLKFNGLDEIYDLMYQISSEDQINKFNKFIDEHDLEGQFIQKINVLEKYENMWIVAKRVLYINLVFSALVLLLEIIIINSIIILEYKVNAIELSIKKVLGYSIFQKNRKIIMMTVITTISSMLIAIIANIIMETQIGHYLALGGLIILILEISVITFNINRIEKSNIQKILKGGNL